MKINGRDIAEELYADLRVRFAALGSGSRGNCALVEFGSTLLMIDCGLPRKVVEERLQSLDRDPRDVAAYVLSAFEGHEDPDALAAEAVRCATAIAVDGVADAERRWP